MSLTLAFNRESMIPGITHAPVPLSVQAVDVRHTLEHAFGENAPAVDAGMDLSR